LKILIKIFNTNRISAKFLKNIVNFYVVKWDKQRANAPINIEKRNRYLTNRAAYFWNHQEKQNIWKELQQYATINKITHKQWWTSSFKPHYRFWTHSNYFWVNLQQWYTDIKWSGHKHILKRIITPKLPFLELITRQKFGPKWKSRIKCYINSRSYKYAPRTEYLIEEEGKKTQEWLHKLINTTINRRVKKRFGPNLELQYRKKKYFYQQYKKKEK